jgi:hypothetical protein
LGKAASCRKAAEISALPKTLIEGFEKARSLLKNSSPL